MPVNTHPLGSGRDAYGDLPGATGIFLSEVKWFAHRPLTFLLWAGVFERHPDLVFVLTEQQIDWVPETLAWYDDLYQRPIFAQIREDLSLLPSEYWRRQCYLGASFTYRHEVELRSVIGVDKIMWGSDYPHAEGTWPNTRQVAARRVRGDPVRRARRDARRQRGARLRLRGREARAAGRAHRAGAEQLRLTRRKASS